MKTIITLAILAATTTICHAATVTAESPICKTPELVAKFAQAKMFTDVPTLESIASSGECTFVEPDIKATIIERGTYPKVIVYVPYQKPITGYTTADNLIQ